LFPARIACLSLILIQSLLITSPATAAEAVSDAAERRLREVLALVDRGDATAAEAYVARHVAAGDAAGMSPGEALVRLAQLHDQTRGIDVADGAIRSSPTAAEASADGRARLTGEWTAVRVRVEPQPPYRVTSLARVRPSPAPPADSDARRNRSDVELAAEVGAYADRLAAAGAFSGVVLLARVGGDESPFFLHAYGQADKNLGVPVRPDTRFNLGSVTKVFTAVAVLQLAEQGRLSLDDPLAKYLSDVPDAESAKGITIRQLLTHTSGLGDHVNAMARDPFKARFRTIGPMLELVRGVPPLFEPGARWRYSNSGFLVLGAVIERASGEDYYGYVRRHVFAPAGMTDAAHVELDRVNERLAVGYQREYDAAAGGRPYWRNNQFDLFVRGGPEGGAYATADDLLHFARALRGGRLLGPEITRQAMAAHPELNSPGYGYGFEVEAGGRVVGHGGGFVGVQVKLDLICPAGSDGPEYVAIVLSNYSGGARPVVEKVRRLLLGPGSPNPAP
jgi:CubicO group peptidase (beta-lactamase class C family)